HRGRVAALLGNYGHVITTAPLHQLLARSGAEGISGSKQDMGASLLKSVGKLPYRCGLACAIYSGNHHDQWFDATQRKSFFQRRKMFGEQITQSIARLGR